MTDKELKQLEIDALALRKIADSFLKQVQAAKTKAAPARKRANSPTRAERVAALKARILSGKRKPDPISKSKKG